MRRKALVLVGAVALGATAIGAGVGTTVAAFSAQTSNGGNTFSAAASFGGCTASTVRVLAIQDSWISQEFPDTNNGSGAFATAVLVKSYFDDKGADAGPKNERTLLDFALPAKPAGCVLSSAFLRLRRYAGTAGRTIHALRATSAWNESTVTWNNHPGSAGTPAPQYALRTGWVDWLVTDHVEAMYTGGSYGFVLQDSAEGSVGTAFQNNFYSKEGSTYAAAELVLRFAPAACSTPGPAAEVLVDSDSYVNQAAVTTNYGAATDINVRSQAAANQRILLDFTLPSVPAGCAPVAAQIRAYTNTGGTGRTLDLFRAASAWTENGVTWNNQPATAGTPATTRSANITLHPWSPTGAFLEALYAADYGLVLKESAEDSGTAVTQIFDAREKAGGTAARMIVIFG